MKITTTLLIAFAITLNSYAQNVSGIVTSESSKPIEGTYVYNENSGSYSFTSEVGKFIIPKTTTGDILRIGSIGYETQYVNIEEQNSDKILAVKLKEKAKNSVASRDNVAMEFLISSLACQIQEKQNLLELNSEKKRIKYLLRHLKSLLPSITDKKQLEKIVQNDGYFKAK